MENIITLMRLVEESQNRISTVIGFLDGKEGRRLEKKADTIERKLADLKEELRDLLPR